MQIILVHHRLARARTLTIGPAHLALALAAFIAIVLACVTVVYLATFRHAADINVPIVRDLLLSANQGEADRKDKYMRENLNAMAVKLGQMQAQLMRLDALGERVSGLAGLPQREMDNFKRQPARGGSEPVEGRSLSLAEFNSELDRLAAGIEGRSDALNVIETELMNTKLQSKMMPTMQPVDVSYNASGFGWRIDPFTGQETMHQGIDFVAHPFTPIVAAAGGVVVASEWHRDFGNMIEIDHGNDITTLYGHTSRVYVKVGDIVRRGDHIADVGSTGRATGPHLHFEVHVKGVPQNPGKFLAHDNATLQQQVAAAAFGSKALSGLSR